MSRISDGRARISGDVELYLGSQKTRYTSVTGSHPFALVACGSLRHGGWAAQHRPRGEGEGGRTLETAEGNLIDRRPKR